MEQVIKAGRSFLFFLFGFALVVPPLFIATSSTYRYIIPKASLFFLLVDLMVVMTALIPFPEKKKLLSLLREPLSILLLLFLLFQFISAFMGLNLERSLFGVPYRMLGVLPFLHFLFFYLLIRLFVTEEKHFKRLVFASVLTGLVASLPSVLKFASPIQNISSFGNDGFLGQYLLLNFFLACWLLTKKMNFFLKQSVVLMVIIMALTIMSTGIRGIFLGLLFGGTLLVILQARAIIQKMHTSLRSFLFTISTLVMLSLLVFGIVMNRYPHSQFTNNIKRLATISFESPTVQTRWIANTISLNAFLDRPFFGVGPENYEYAFSKHYNPMLLSFGIQETIFDKAHNYYLQLLVELGLTGGLVFMLLVLFLFWNARKEPIFLSLLASYFLTLLFEVEFTILFSTFFFVLAFMMAMLKNNTEIPPSSLQKRPIVSLCFSLGFLFLASFSILYYSLFTQSFFQNKETFHQLLKTKFPEKEVESLLKSDSFLHQQFPFTQFQENFSNIDILLFFAANNPTVLNHVPSSFLQQFGSLLEKNLDRYPYEIRQKLVLCFLYKTWSQSDRSFIAAAEACYQKAIQGAPHDQVFLLGLAQLMKDHPTQYTKQEIISGFEKLIAIQADVPIPYWELGKYYLEQGQGQDAVVFLNKALDRKIFTSDIFVKLSDVVNPLVAGKHYQTLVRLYQRIIEIAPEQPIWRTKLAVVYLEMGDRDNAQREAKKAIEIDPSLKKGGQAFFESLEKLPPAL